MGARRSRGFVGWGVIVALLLSAWSASAVATSSSDPQTLFKEGNQLYVKGKYEAAARMYAQVLTDHELDDPSLYLNLGNAYFRLKRYGSAIFFFRRGLRLNPEAELAERIERNLKATRRKLQVRYRASGDANAFIYTEPGGLVFRLTRILSSKTAVILFLLLWAGLMSILAWRRLAPTPNFVGSVSAGLGILVVLTGLMLWGQVYSERTFRLGVVIEQGVTLKQGKHPDATGEPLREGVEVRIVESDEEWARVRRSDGAEGWVEAASVKQI
jgi:tetratricopeptide (TPR) repeat protein